jgi:putative phosphoribosyl transferase
MVLLKGKPYADRRQAARLLGKSLTGYETYHPLILGIPRGGAVVADTIAQGLKADLDIVLTRKLGAQDAIERLEREADDVVCPYVPPYFYAIGQFYADFGQVDDQEVIEILQAYNRPAGDGRQRTEGSERRTADK